MFKLFAWDVTLTLRGPILTTSSAPEEFGVDAPFSRNAAGEYYLPGTLVKGKLKEAWKELEEAGPSELCQWEWKRWLGRDPGDKEEWTNIRGLVHFADFLYAGDDGREIEGKSETLYRIRQDDESATVAFGQNLMISTPFLSNGLYPFKGRVWALMNDVEANTLEAGLGTGLCWIPGVGADHTVGFGVVADVQVERLNEMDYKRAIGFVKTPEADTWWIALKPDGPLCIGGKRIADNIFESEQEIPGGVLKGAIADALIRVHNGDARDVVSLATFATCTIRELCSEFSKIRVLHAKPVDTGIRKRPMAIPASAVLSGTPPALHDVAIRERPEESNAPRFQIDWKPGADAEDRFGAVRAPYELRVRTQIDSTQRRAANGKLFAYRMTAPRALVLEKKGELAEIKLKSYEWVTAISFHNITDRETREKVKEQLSRLISLVGIPGIGKLKTYCMVECLNVGPPDANQAQNEKKGEHRWVITLQSPALLCDISAAQGGLSSARDAYQSYWADTSDNALVLERYFARQHLAGGEYLWRHLSKEANYRPYVLTDAGAVFVLRAANGADLDSTEKKIAEWQQNGLPVAKSVCTNYGLAGDDSDWSRCPYIPENGYGEVAVDLKWHWQEALL